MAVFFCLVTFFFFSCLIREVGVRVEVRVGVGVKVKVGVKVRVRVGVKVKVKVRVKVGVKVIPPVTQGIPNPNFKP